MPPNRHAVLSASSSHRWLHCNPSARLELEFEDRETEAAAEGTAAHALAEHKLRKALKMRSTRPVSKYDSDEMEMYTDRRGHLNGFRNIPLDDLREHLDELERDKPVYVNCQTGLRSYLACRLLTQYGFTCAHLSGGYSFYQVVTQERQTARSAYPCGMEKL